MKTRLPVLLVDRNTSEHWIEVEEEKPGTFVVVGQNITEEPDNWCLGIYQGSEEVENLDTDSQRSWKGVSERLKWNEVEFFYYETGDEPQSWGDPLKIKTPSLERLKEALLHIAFCGWDPMDL